MRTPFLMGLPGLTLSTEDQERLQRIRPWGVILFARNFESVPQIKELIQSIKDLIGSDTMVAIDHEGGRVVRFPEHLPSFPAPRIFGEQKDLNKMKQASRESGEALRDWGFTINLAPVVDTWTSTSHQRMYDRCFGSDPQLISEMAIAFMEGMHEAGLKCTAKHFPGIGPAKHDTHDRGTVIDWSREEMEKLWIPFRAIIKAGVDSVMITHGTYPAIDPDVPATFSHKVITGVLREELGFQGTIISDDLEMGAIIKHFPIAESTIKALEAGCDIACLCLDTKLQDQAYESYQNRA